MKLGWLGVLPVVALAVHVAAVAGFGATDTVWWSLQISWQVIGAAGCLAAVAAFRPGDLLWKAWAATGASLALPTLLRLVNGPQRTWPLAPALSDPSLQLGILITINAFSVAGALLFLAAFRRAAPGLGLSDGRRIRAFAVTLGGALVIGIPVLALDARDAVGGGLSSQALAAAVSVTGDMICFAAVGPLALVARGLMGGALQRTWTLLAVYNLGWLFYDLTTTTARVTGHEDAGTLVAEAVLCVACVVVGAAGFAQRLALRDVTRRAAARASSLAA